MTDHLPTGVLDVSDAYIPRNLTLNELDIIHEDGSRDVEPTIMMILTVSPVGNLEVRIDLKFILARTPMQKFAESILDGLRHMDDQD